MNHFNPIHTNKTYSLHIHFHIILPFMIRFSKKILSKRTTQTQNKCRDINASSGTRTHNPSVWVAKDISCFRPHAHCDWLANQNLGNGLTVTHFNNFQYRKYKLRALLQILIIWMFHCISQPPLCMTLLLILILSTQISIPNSVLQCKKINDILHDTFSPTKWSS
jgi:hypothetical protein